MTLSEFLLARIDATERGMVHGYGAWPVETDEYGASTGKAIVPSRVLAECEAKRQIVEDADTLAADAAITHDQVTVTRRYQAMVAIAHLAAVYADHPDYDESWRP